MTGLREPGHRIGLSVPRPVSNEPIAHHNAAGDQTGERECKRPMMNRPLRHGMCCRSAPVCASAKRGEDPLASRDISRWPGVFDRRRTHVRRVSKTGSAMYLRPGQCSGGWRRRRAHQSREKRAGRQDSDGGPGPGAGCDGTVGPGPAAQDCLRQRWHGGRWRDRDPGGPCGAGDAAVARTVVHGPALGRLAPVSA